jgi:hypothetical protein
VEPLPQPDQFVDRSQPDDDIRMFDIDAFAALAEFEAEHQRVLALQSLYRRRSREAGGAA